MSVLAAELRKPLNELVSVFLGDVFAYLDHRGDAAKPGEISQRLIDKLRIMHANRRERGGEPLVVLSHSMGGQIVYDAVTHFLPGDPALRDTREKLDSPLAATVAALVLLRANRLDLLHDWLRNLANWFDERPDGPALWAEQLMRQQMDRGKALEEASDYLAELLPRGLPHTGEGLSYAARMSDIFARLSDRLPQSQRPRLAAVAERIRNALPLFRPGGLFASYAGFDPAAEPTLLIGPFDGEP